jgi:hypothetical protein
MMSDSSDDLHVLDVAISAMQQEMWSRVGMPPSSMHQLAEWVKNFVLLDKESALKIFGERVPGLVESIPDVKGDFWDGLWLRIQERKIREL